MDYLNTSSQNQVLSSGAYRQQLQKKQSQLPQSCPMSSKYTASPALTIIRVTEDKNKPAISPVVIAKPSTPSTIDTVTSPPSDISPSIDQTSESSEESVVLTINVNKIESRLAWSQRMKRYQQEEIQYLGLELIHPATNLYQTTHFLESTSPSSTKLPAKSHLPSTAVRVDVRQRFESWLDGLYPHSSPAIPVSLPSTIAESEDSFVSEEIVAQEGDLIECASGEGTRGVEKCRECGSVVSRSVEGYKRGCRRSLWAG